MAVEGQSPIDIVNTSLQYLAASVQNPEKQSAALK